MVRVKHRWLAVEFERGSPAGAPGGGGGGRTRLSDVTEAQLSEAVMDSVQALFGAIGSAQVERGFKVALWVPRLSLAVFKCLREDAEKLHVSLVVLKQIQSTQIRPYVFCCAATLFHSKKVVIERLHWHLNKIHGAAKPHAPSVLETHGPSLRMAAIME